MRHFKYSSPIPEIFYSNFNLQKNKKSNMSETPLQRVDTGMKKHEEPPSPPSPPPRSPPTLLLTIPDLYLEIYVWPQSILILSLKKEMHEPGRICMKNLYVQCETHTFLTNSKISYHAQHYSIVSVGN